MKTALLAIVWIIIIPTSIGYAWETWKRHDDLECSKNPECRERRAEIDKQVVHSEMSGGANQNYYRGE